MSLMTQKRPAPINAELYDDFLREVGRRKGAIDGSVREALEEAVKDWINKK